MGLMRRTVRASLIGLFLAIPVGVVAETPSDRNDDQGLREVLEIAQDVLFPNGAKTRLSRWAYAPVTLAVNATPEEEELLRDALRQFSMPLGGELQVTTSRTAASMPVFFLDRFDQILDYTDVIANCLGSGTMPELIQATVDDIRAARTDLYVAPAEKQNVIGCAPIVLSRDHPERHRKLLMRGMAISFGLRGTTGYESVTTNNKRDDRISQADGILLHIAYHLAKPGMSWAEVKVLIEQAWVHRNGPASR
jgi:hypothetical protein